MSLASETAITIPGGVSELSKLQKGDMVLAWTPEGSANNPVIFSSGTEGDSRQTVIYIRFDDNSLITTMDQAMILVDQTIKRADQLIPNVDHLLGSNGQPVKVNMVYSGYYSKGLHHIAINSSEPGDNHLVIANGIVVGDYVLERYM